MNRPKRGVSLFWLPAVLVWTVVKVLALPAVVVAVSWWLLPDRWAQAVTGLAVLYLAAVTVFAGAQLRGRLRSMARGTFTVRQDKTGRRGR